MTRDLARAAILISGSGSNLQSFIDRIASGCLALEIAVVFSNRGDAFGLTRAAKAGIPTAVVSHRDYDDRETFDRAVVERLDACKPDLIILAGFMRILSPWFVQHYAGRILNIHPALLPLYPGLDTHQRVIEAGDPYHGSTVHFVTDDLDGGPRLIQGRLPVVAGETVSELQRRVQGVEHQIYPQAAALVAGRRARCADEVATIDGAPLEEPLIIDFDEYGKLISKDNG